MNIVFLDFDGVINSTRISNIDGTHVDIRCLDLLTSALDIINAKVVVTSSWRTVGIDFIRKRFKDVNRESFIDNYFHENWNTISLHNKERGYEVKEWLTRHSDIDNYVCIDDDSDYLENQKLIQTDTRTGFSVLDQEILLASFGKTSYFDETRQKQYILSEISRIDRIQKNRKKLIKELES